MSIDWSTAPEGATHFNKAGGANHRLYSWMQLVDGEWFFYRWGRWERQLDNFPDKHDQLVERPIAGDGEGMPPIGSHVVVVDDGTLRYGQGESGEVLAHVDGTAVIRMSYGLGCFLPRILRTKDQIEAERLKAAIDDMINVGACGPDVTIAQARIVAERLAKAGYRKFEIVDKDDGEGEV